MAQEKGIQRKGRDQSIILILGVACWANSVTCCMNGNAFNVGLARAK